MNAVIKEQTYVKIKDIVQDRIPLYADYVAYQPSGQGEIMMI